MSKKFGVSKAFYLAMTILVAIEIFLFSNISTPVGGVTGFNLATLYHFSIFFAFTFFLSMLLKGNKLNFKTTLIIFLISLAYAISDEFHQLFVIGRFASVEDILVDVFGSALALLTIKIVEIFKKV